MACLVINIPIEKELSAPLDLFSSEDHCGGKTMVGILYREGNIPIAEHVSQRCSAILCRDHLHFLPLGGSKPAHCPESLPDLRDGPIPTCPWKKRTAEHVWQTCCATFCRYQQAHCLERGVGWLGGSIRKASSTYLRRHH